MEAVVKSSLSHLTAANVCVCVCVHQTDLASSFCVDRFVEVVTKDTGVWQQKKQQGFLVD